MGQFLPPRLGSGRPKATRIRIHNTIQFYQEAVSVIGVGYDSVDKRVYWTDVKLGKETIESVTTDGHNRRVVLSTGLGMPEDLVVDETSRNIYFRSAAIQKECLT